MTAAIFENLESNRDQRVDRLLAYLRIASISTEPEYADDIQRAAEWTADQLRECGLEVAIHPSNSHPVVLGRWTDALAEAPHVLFYGHYDVQPPDPLDKWTTPPFEPTVRDGAIYARGASDDKGQVMCFIEALRAWQQVEGTLPVRLTVMIEGDEECGSAELDPFVEQHRDTLAADIAVVSDTAFWDHTPAITYALRGLLYFDVKLHGPSRDLHSGVYGGTIANPMNELVKVLGRLFDADHHIAIDGFYDNVETPHAAERAEWDKLGLTDAMWARTAGMDAVWGEGGYSTLERRWSRPSCDINGLYGGYQGAGAKTVIPTTAGAKVSFRLAARQDPKRCAKLFRAWLEARTPAGCRWEVREFGKAEPVIVSTDSPYLAAARRALEAGCGQPAVLVREGATIPVIGTIKNRLGIDTLLMGFGRHDDAIHSPNEKFELQQFDYGCRSHAALLGELAKLQA